MGKPERARGRESGSERVNGMSDMAERWDHDLGGVFSGRAMRAQPRYKSRNEYQGLDLTSSFSDKSMRVIDKAGIKRSGVHD